MVSYNGLRRSIKSCCSELQHGTLKICLSTNDNAVQQVRQCPQCGYFGDDSALPLSEQALGEIVPAEYEITAWVPEDDTDAPLNRTAKGLIARFFSNWEIFRKAVPELSLSIQRILEKPQTEYRAKWTPELRKLMSEGRLRFKVDKQGELMAVLQDGRTSSASRSGLKRFISPPTSSRPLTA